MGEVTDCRCRTTQPAKLAGRMLRTKQACRTAGATGSGRRLGPAFGEKGSLAKPMDAQTPPRYPQPQERERERGPDGDRVSNSNCATKLIKQGNIYCTRVK
jgi:hypothetical protein